MRGFIFLLWNLRSIPKALSLTTKGGIELDPEDDDKDTNDDDSWFDDHSTYGSEE